MFLKILLGFIIAIALLLLILRLTGKQHMECPAPGPNLSSWMANLPDDTPINQIAIPGSHDAGTVGAIWAAETQCTSIEKQLLYGSRYFDVRVHKKGENQYCIFHSIADGMDFIPVLNWFKNFIKKNPSEILFLDFQHFKGDSQEDVHRLLKEALYSEGLLLENTSGKSDIEFLRSTTLGQARGKCIIFYGDESPLPAKYIFARNTNLCTRDDASLDSYYIAADHKKDAKYLIETGHPKYFERMERLKAEGKDPIFVLQCQQSDGIAVRGPWAIDRQSRQYMTNYINSLKDSKYLKDINIIMRDFITPDICYDIINLNYYKGLMKVPLE